MRHSLVIVASLFVILAVTNPSAAQQTFDQDILADTFKVTATTPKSVVLSDLHQGCSHRDCIPSIDNPKYVNVAGATFLDDDDIVLAMSIKGYAKAWPARILDKHEIVNDIIAGVPIAVTWCPLCGSAVGVVREIDGQLTEFGVSGLLYNSDLVFYDRKTETLWDQIEAKGIVGPLTGTELEIVPITTTRWGVWRKAHPDTQVLSPDTGFRFDYTTDVYARYRNNQRLMFPVANENDALRPKSVVYGFIVGDHKVAVSAEYLEKMPRSEQTLDDHLYVLNVAEDGGVTLSDTLSDQTYAPTRLYWFAWYTFHPDTDLIN